MRTRGLDPERYNQEFMEVAMEHLRIAAELIAEDARQRCPEGTITRPVYKSGPYAGQPWTAREAGSLKKTIRVVEKKEKYGAEFFSLFRRNVRVYAGNYIVYYAQIVEYGGKKFMRPAVNAGRRYIKSIVSRSAA